MAPQPIRILLAEDNAADAELELRELKRAGLQVAHRIVESGSDFVRGLEEFVPDVIISDFSMPAFDGMEALRLARDLAPDTPFLFVSGTLGEDYAIRALKSGATDYVLKTNLIRLPPAIERALEGAGERRARRGAQAALRRAQVMAKLAHVITGPGGAFESWSDSLPGLIGVEKTDVPKTIREWLDLLHPEDREVFRRKCKEAGATGQRVEVTYRLRRADGAWIHVRQLIEPFGVGAGADQAGQWFNTLQDVTDQKQAEESVKRLNRVYAVLSGINSLIVRARSRNELFGDACRIAVQEGQFRLAWIGLVDQASSSIVLTASAGDADGYVTNMPLAINQEFPEGQGLAGLAIALKAQALERGFNSLVVLPLIVAGAPIGVMALYAEQAGFFDDQEMKLLRELAGDISFAVDHIAKSDRLEYLSYYDQTTGLANRMLLMDRLAQSLAANQDGKKLALVIIDVERFKTINDTLGRPAGDELLRKLAARLVELSGDSSRVARIGADHFAVMIPNVRAVEVVAHAIDEGFARIEGQALSVGGSELRIAIKSGIAIFPDDGADADSVFRNAEAALKKAKSSGEKYLFYTQEMTRRVAGRLSLENKLRQAIEREEFVLHYQPKVDLEERFVLGVEALIRWNSPEGLVPPLQFVPLLEETGLIVQAGAWALRQAVLDHRAWMRMGLKAPRVAVNVSAIQLRHKNFLSVVKETLPQGSSPACLDLEITESLLMDDIQGNVEKLDALRALGVEIAIDDFGTGYSSLGYLAKLPVQSLKIDRSFVITMDKDANALTLVSTIISLAHSLRLSVVAEGVETENQANTLRLLRCDAMQGYLYSKPLPMDGLVALLQKSPSVRTAKARR